MNLLLQVYLDSTLPHEKLVHDLIQSQPQKTQKEFLLSAVLYYSKSPSFLAEVKMTESLEKLERLTAILDDPLYKDMIKRIEEVTELQDNLIAHVASAVSSKVLAALEGLELSSSPKTKAKKAEHVATPDDLLSGMVGDFST